MSLFTDKMTVYNYYTDARGNECWKRTVVDYVQWRHNKNETKLVDGVLTSTVGESITVSDFSKFKAPNEWQSDSECWTLDATTNMDVVVLGECLSEITETYTLDNLLSDYKGNCGTVKAVTDARNRDLLPHIKVVAR